MKQKIKLMAHQIALYPNKEAALLYAQALVEGGAEILEIQIPFSDPVLTVLLYKRLVHKQSQQGCALRIVLLLLKVYMKPFQSFVFIL